MAKRKRTTNLSAPPAKVETKPTKKVKQAEAPKAKTKTSPKTAPTSIQIVAGSYDRVLHGVVAAIPAEGEVEFADTFLFNAHASAIRCLALSPPSAVIPGQTQKIILASGSTDERINLYHLSAHPPSQTTIPAIPSLTSKAVVENPQNRELGSLLHHASSITALHFPMRSKLLSSAEDSTIAVTRTRDWSLLSTIKAPIPKPLGRPSGDTAPPGGTPAGVNDFAVHPSMKLMITVGKGEKSMRLWNLVTGKKAGVLNFGREILSEIGEGRHGSGEGRKVAWGSTDAGEEFCVGFDRGILVFGMDSKPKCKVVPEPKSKIHQLTYIQIDEEKEVQLMAVSTEDGRILFFSTRPDDLIRSPTVEGKEDPLPTAKLVAQIGGKEVGFAGRVKDFTVLNVGSGATRTSIVVAGGSDGALRLWQLDTAKDLQPEKGSKVKQVGKLIGTYETGNRITCLKGFVMIPRPDGAEDDIGDLEEGEEDAESSNSDSDSE
ncbi:Protein MAK11 [Phlyctema vagabunda]|uniref:Protein MAK11 n=1 Tax=Phlyctema vagabunda TaxID=108571 RepID=A0ABR4P4F0_9HELO